MNKKDANGRKDTPDILANLMGSVNEAKEQESPKTLQPDSNNTIIENRLSLDESSLNNKALMLAGKLDNNKAIMGALKEKTTFNLSLKTLESLEDVWMKLRRKLKGEQRITKTLIVEKAIEMAIYDFEKKSELGDLYTRLKE